MTPLFKAARALVAVRAGGVCSVPRELFSFSMILQLLTACSTIVLPPAPLIIVGPGCQSTQLLTAKLAAAAGHRVQVVTRTADVRNSNRLMYGSAELPESPPLFCAKTRRSQVHLAPQRAWSSAWRAARLRPRRQASAR